MVKPRCHGAHDRILLLALSAPGYVNFDGKPG
jgi:hypothetical protein